MKPMLETDAILIESWLSEAEERSLANDVLDGGDGACATYACADDFSGIVRCGAKFYAPGTTLETHNITSPIDTSRPGSATFTVVAVDAAGNVSTATVSYQVVASSGSGGRHP